MVLDVAWGSEELARRVCDSLVDKGLMKTKPAFIRTDREACYTKAFREAGLDGQKLSLLHDRASLEQLLRIATGGEGSVWLESVITEVFEIRQGGIVGKVVSSHASSDADASSTASLDSMPESQATVEIASSTASSNSYDPDADAKERRTEFVFKGCEQLAKQICDNLVEKGMLKTKPAFIRKDREAKISEVFSNGGLDQLALSSFCESSCIERWLSLTSGEVFAWSQTVAVELISMLQNGNSDVQQPEPKSESQPSVAQAPRIEENVEQVVYSAPDARLDDFQRLAKRICDKLVSKGMLKERPAFIRSDRQAQIFEACKNTGLSSETLWAVSDQSRIEKLLVDATFGESCAWVKNVSLMFVEMIEDGETPGVLAELEKLEQMSMTETETLMATPQKSSGAARDGEENSPRSVTSLSTSTSTAGARRVSWCTAPIEEMEITPYAEVYGVHPTDFDFDELGRKVSNDPCTNGRYFYD